LLVQSKQYPKKQKRGFVKTLRPSRSSQNDRVGKKVRQVGKRMQGKLGCCGSRPDGLGPSRGKHHSITLTAWEKSKESVIGKAGKRKGEHVDVTNDRVETSAKGKKKTRRPGTAMERSARKGKAT